MKAFIIVISALLLLSCSIENSAEKFDLVILNGRIVDGTGTPWFTADIGIKGDRIVKIGEITPDEGINYLDASGKYVSPGFIDIHSHAERNILNDRTVEHMSRQGNTTIIGGNCGGSITSFPSFFRGFEKGGAAMNVGVQIGHNSVRRRVMGNEGREPTTKEMDKMKDIVRKAMEAGALGISTGLKYRPGVYSTTEEVLELVKIAAEYGGFYSTHLRDEGLKLFESMDEAINIAEKAGIPLQLSHHKAAGADMWGKTVESLKKMEDARARGIEVTTDLHPYPATFTTAAIIIPPWALEGSTKDIRKRLNDPEIRKKVIDGIVYNIIHDRGGNDISNIRIAWHPADTNLEGKNLREILELKGRETTMENAADLLLDLFMAKGSASCVYFCLSMDDIVRILKHPLAMFGSDAGNAEYNAGKVHPRHYGHFPRIIAHHVKDRGDFSLEEAIRKMTSFPASKVGARDRGVISTGKYADIVIFDYEDIRDNATFDDPHQYPDGIEHVFVNGIQVVKNGKITGKTPGKIIYGPGKK